MLLLLHIVIAVSGIILSTITYFLPSRNKIRFCSLLVAATVASGTVIIIRQHLSIMSVCLSGLLYIGFTAGALIAASRRLAKDHA